jgi:glycerol uptake facilitator-like aquaporin
MDSFFAGSTTSLFVNEAFGTGLIFLALNWADLNRFKMGYIYHLFGKSLIFVVANLLFSTDRLGHFNPAITVAHFSKESLQKSYQSKFINISIRDFWVAI